MAALEQSRSKLVDELDHVQKKAFTKWVNSHLEKADIEIEDLFQDLRDGSILLLLLELFTGTKLKRERGKMRVHHLQNVQRALSFLTDQQKIKIVGIPVEEIVGGNKKLTLGLVWMLILNYELSGALPVDQDKRPTSPKQISAKAIKEELLQWSQRATEGYDEVSIRNFHTSWNDGMAFCAIINRHRPDLLDYDECDPNKPLENLEKAFTIAEKELEVTRFLDPEDVNVQKPAEEAILMYVSALKQAFPDMPPPHRRKGPPISPEEYADRYANLQEWIDSRLELTTNRDFPSSSAEVRNLLEEFQKLRSVEDPEKEKEKEEVRTMAAEIRVFELKSKKEFGVPQIKDLEQGWADAIAGSNEYERVLKEELERLERLESLSTQLQSSCQAVSIKLDSMDKQLVLLESEGVSSQDEIAKLQGSVKGVKETLEGLETNIQSLKDSEYPGWSQFDEKVSGFWKALSSIRSRLDACVTAESDSQLLIAEADAKLRGCELWLLENGKFSDNQFIMQQKENYELFKSTQLAEADSVMGRVSSSPLPGLDDEVKDLNKRWEQVREQLQSRVSNLATISGTVVTFDSVKSPLQEWCVSQHDQYSSLPLLETSRQELEGQKEKFQQMLSEVLVHQQIVVTLETLSADFVKHKEPIQTSADKYARRLKRVSRNFATAVVKGPSEDETAVTLYEQSEALKGEWERNRDRVQQRIEQANSLLDRLTEFEKKHAALMELINEGEELLKTEQPVGKSAQRIEEQMATCQAFRLRLADAQPNVDSMLALGRSIIGEYYTNPEKDTMSQTLTDFISNWSNLQMSWQNWYDELHATGEQSRNLSDQFVELKQAFKAIEPKQKEMFPAHVTMDTLESDLKELQDQFSREVLVPLESQKKNFASLSSNVHLLSEKDDVERVLERFKALLERAESQEAELSELVDNVSCWWAECEMIIGKVTEMREDLCEELPLAGSVPYIKKQDDTIQSVLLKVEEMKPKVVRTVKHLMSLAEHEGLIVCKPILQHKDEFQQQWKELFEQAESRRDLTEVGRVRLSVYIENRDPFDIWLREAESKLLGNKWRRVDTLSKDQLVELTESLKVFKMDVEMHSHEMECCESMAGKFMESAKKHQSVLLLYKRKLHPDPSSSQLLPEHFFDWETEGLNTLSATPINGEVSSLHDQNYHNGLQVVNDDLYQEKKRFDRLKGRVARRSQRFEEAREKRIAFEEALETVLPKLEETETLLSQLKDGGIGKGGNKSLKEQLDIMESLETEFSSLRSLMDPLNLSAAAWMVREPVDSECEDEEGEGRDECFQENERVQQRYLDIERGLKNLREELESSLAEAQAFQSAYSSFASWLRDMERKIQKDDPLKLETTDLKSGLAYMKAVSSDILGHTESFHELCRRFQTAIEVAKGGEEADIKDKLENLESRWNGLQVIHEDIEAIQGTIQLLESFNVSYHNLMQRVDDLVGELNRFSPSAITGEGVDKKKAEFEKLLTQFSYCQSEFDSLLSNYKDLFDSPFDQTKFRRSVDVLKEKIQECKKLKDDKNRALKHIITRVKSLEMNWAEFQPWLTSSENKMEGLDQSLALATGGTNLSEQLKAVQALQEDISEHEAAMESIESLVSSLVSYLEPHHMGKLEVQFNNLFGRYRCLAFSSQAYPVQVWIYNRSGDLVSMGPCAVLVRLLQTQIQEITKFQAQLESYRPRITELEELMASLPEQSDLSLPKTKMADVQTQFSKLSKLADQRNQILSSTLPRLKLYQNSLDTWEATLKGWEESVLQLAPPSTAILIIQSTIENIKALQQVISDQEPEFYYLLREAKQMYAGSADYQHLMEQVRALSSPQQTLEQVETRPGQPELQNRLDEDHKRLESLKRRLLDLMTTLNTLSEKITAFERLINLLLPWVKEQASNVKDLEFKEPVYRVLQGQLEKCQSMRGHLQLKQSQRDELLAAYTDISSCLPPDCDDVQALKNKTDELQTCWSSLSDQLITAQSHLEPSAKLAKLYETAQEKLQAFVKLVLGELTGLGPVPSEPEAVQELKIRIDDLKSEYNGLAPLSAKCVEDGLGILKYCPDPTKQGQHKGNVEEFQKQWDTVGTMLSDIHQKLTDALMQTQEFQQVADSLDRWVNATQSSLKRLEHVALRVRLIDPQIEGLKPVIEDISVNKVAMEQAKLIGQQLLTEATTEERLKIGKKLHSLEMRFYGLDKTTSNRMKELEDALQKATEYEGNCSELSDWLKSQEEQMATMFATPIRSQPLKTLVKEAKEFNQEVLARKPLVTSVSSSETALFNTDLHTIQKYELRENFIEYLSSPQHSRGPSPMPGYSPRPGTPVDLRVPLQHEDPLAESPVHPEFLDRPGSLEALEAGAKLRDRYRKLKSGSTRKAEEIARIFETVVDYESKFAGFSTWLQEMDEKTQALAPLATSCEEMKRQLHELTTLQHNMADKEQPLEEINVTGTSLVDRCRDELSRDSVRDSLSGLNERWGNLSRRIDDRADKLKRGISLAERYEDLEREFKSWLSETEAKLDKPVSVTGSTSEMQLIVKKLESFQTDIDSHKPRLISLVAVGQDLETFALSNAETAVSSLFLDYSDCQSRYEALLSKLEVKRRGTVDNVQRASQLKSGLISVLEQLQALKVQLENHEPPHILPDPIAEQLHQLEAISQQHSSLQANISELLELSASFHLEEGSELFNLNSNVSATNQDVLEGLQQWQTRLQRARDSAVKFDRDYNSFSRWLSDMERKLNTDEGMRGTVEGVETQIRNTKELKEEITAHSEPLQKLMDLGRGLMSGASPEDCVLIGDRLAHIQSNYESLQRHALGKIRTLNEGLERVKEFTDEHRRTLDKLQDKEADLHIVPPVGTDVETVKSQLEDFKEFETELAEMKTKVAACQLKGKQIKDACHRDDQSKIDTKLEELTTAWNELQSLSVARQQDLENALLRLGQFQEALMELLSWIRDCSGKLVARKEPGVDIEELEQQINDLKVLQSEIVSREPSVSSLNDASRKLVSSSQDDTNRQEIQGNMEQLNQEWQDLKSLAADKHLTLSTAHERARVFHSDLREIVKKFNDAEEQALMEWKPHAFPNSCQKDLEDHQEFASVVQGLKEPVGNIRSEAEVLKAQASPSECETITRRMSDLKDRWEELVVTLEEKQNSLEEAKATADSFDQEFVGLSTKLDDLENQAKESSTIHSEAEEVKRQLEAHKDFLSLLKQLEGEVTELEKMGGALGKNCVPEDGKTIKRNLAKLRSQYDGLQSSALSRLSDLEEALLTVGRFEEAHQELRNWLGQAWDLLQGAEPIPGQSEAVIALLAKHRVLQKELGARSSSHASVIKAGKELMKTKQGEDRSVLKSKLADLEQEWEGVCQMSIARQQRLENASKKLRQFETQTQNFKSWMTKILPSLDESVPVDGDIDTVYELIQAHEAFQNELGSHQKSFDSVSNLGEDILSGVVDLPAPVKENLDEVVVLWDSICNLSVQKQERLLKAQKASLKFSQGIEALWARMDQKEAEIQLMVPPSEDEEELHLQMQQHRMFEESVLNQQTVFDRVLAAGQHLHRLAHPRAELILLSQLQQLEQKWQGLKDEISSRSEALNSAMLEVHGLQDMIDELSGWVETAEEDMAAAEGMAVGDDLESVEEQLNQHESFQEEMAKHQPKMEALNKASKKRKSRVSLTHGSTSNPEITKKISNLDKRWKRLWLRSNERHRQLLEARTRLKDIAMARSFNFDAWCKKFVSWVDQQKLRVSDLFRRFDSNHDGMLTREEFMKGLKASGLAMNQIEMEKIADSFDRNRSGLIDLAEITAILKGQKVHRQFKTATSAKPISDAEKIDLEIQRQISHCCCEKPFQVVPVKAGQYKFGDSQKVRMVRILRSNVMVRVGGGWEPLDTFLMKNDPCRVSGRTNTDLLPGIGVSQVTFKSKVQSAISTKGEETKRAAEKDPNIKKVTRTLHDGRKETVLMKKSSLPTVKANESGGRDSPSSMRRTYTGTKIGLQQAKGPSTPTRKTSSLTRYMSPPSEAQSRAYMRPRTPSRQQITREKTPPTQLSPERTPSRSKTPTRNGNLDVLQTPTSELRPPSRGPTPSQLPLIKGSRIPTSSSRIPTPSSRTKPPSRK